LLVAGLVAPTPASAICRKLSEREQLAAARVVFACSATSKEREHGANAS